MGWDGTGWIEICRIQTMDQRTGWLYTQMTMISIELNCRVSEIRMNEWGGERKG
jgi:hypothetical protein